MSDVLNESVVAITQTLLQHRSHCIANC